jgi:hypothetical protein
MGAEFFSVDRRTDERADKHDEDNTVVAFCNFANALKNKRNEILF